MRYLIDTNVISELPKRKPNAAVIEWLKATNQSQLYLSCITIGEIQTGVFKLAKRDEVAGRSLQIWLNSLTSDYQEQIISIDLETCEKWACLMAIDSTNAIDSMIAAQASQLSMTLVTRNTKHFEMFGISLFNPFT
jgi:predicted nucleic acid-binding protein